MRTLSFKLYQRTELKSSIIAIMKDQKDRLLWLCSAASYALGKSPIRQLSLNAVIFIAGHASTKTVFKGPLLAVNAPVMSP